MTSPTDPAPTLRDARRDELAESALRTLGELGYARTSLREIAANSPFSHGVVHYYFRDKAELIAYCVRSYKARCIARYDDIVAESSAAAELSSRFADRLAETILEDGAMHRLWYDLRTQSMFDEGLRADVIAIDAALEAMVWRVVERHARLAGRPLTVDPGCAYAMLDGLFERALLGHTAGDLNALAQLRSGARRVLAVSLASAGEDRPGGRA